MVCQTIGQRSDKLYGTKGPVVMVKVLHMAHFTLLESRVVGRTASLK